MSALTFSSLVNDAFATNIDPAVEAFSVAGYAKEGDGGHAWWRRAPSQTSGQGKRLHPINGLWYEYVGSDVVAKALGAVFDGVTLNSAVHEETVQLAEARKGMAIFGPGEYRCTMALVAVGDVEIRCDGVTFIQEHDSRSTLVGAHYKSSSIVTARRGSRNVRWTGRARFTQGQSFQNLSGYGTASAFYFAPIQGYRSDNLSINGDFEFECYAGVAIGIRGGNDGYISPQCRFVRCGLTIHDGFERDVFGYDASSDVSRYYSPCGWTIPALNVLGSSQNPDHDTLVHFTGMTDASIGSVRLTGMDSASCRAIRFYCNDYGTTDRAGNPVDRVSLGPVHVEVKGLVQQAVEIIGDSANGVDTSWDARISLDIEVTGAGVLVERGAGLALVGKRVVASGGFARFADNCAGMEWTGYWECTGTGASGRSCNLASTFEGDDLNWHDLTLVSGPGDTYVMDSTFAVRGPSGRFRNVRWVSRIEDAAAGQVWLLSKLRNVLDIGTWEVEVRHAALNNRRLGSFTKEANQPLVIVGEGIVLSPASVAFNSRGVAATADEVCLDNVRCGAGDFAVTRSLVLGEGCVFTSNIPNVTPLTGSGAGVAHATCRSRLEAGDPAGNVACASFDNFVRVDVSSQYVRSNSTAAQIRATTAGVLHLDPQTHTYNANATPGAPFGVAGSAKLAGDFGAYRNRIGPVLWSDANRLSASICEPGARFFNDTDKDLNFSDGAAWRANGAVT